MAGALHESPLNPRVLELPILSLIADKLTMLLREEQAIRAKTQMEERSRKLEQLESLGLLAAGIAHDFNNILVGVLGNADYLLETLPASADEDTTDSVRDIKEAALAANGLCKQLMLYAGRSRVELSSFDLSTSLSDLVRLSESTLHIPCLFRDEHATQPIYISGDETQIRQVLMNLLTNAIDAASENTAGKGRIRVAMHPLPDKNSMEIIFADNGPGIPPESLPRIFDVMFSTKGSRGTGIGLAVVRKVVDEHGGSIAVQSEPGIDDRQGRPAHYGTGCLPKKVIARNALWQGKHCHEQ